MRERDNITRRLKFMITELSGDRLLKNGTICFAPFGFGTAETGSPNELYRPWLEKEVGEQGKEWEWTIAENNQVRIAFKDERWAIVFALKYGPSYKPS